MESQQIYSPKKIVYILPISIFIMIFDRIQFHPSVDMSLYRVLQIPILLFAILFLLGRMKLTMNFFSFINLYLFGFILISFLSTFYAVSTYVAFDETRSVIELIILAYIIFFFINKMWSEDNWLLLAKSLMIAGMISGLTIFSDLSGWTNFYRLYSDIIPIARPYGILGESNYAAGKLGLFLPFAFYCMIVEWKSKHYFQYIFSIISTLLISIALFLTGSRMGGFIILFSFVVFIIKEINKLLSLKIMILMLTIALLVLIVYLMLPGSENFFADSISYTRESYDTLYHYIMTGEESLGRESLSIRADLFHTGLEIFMEYPILGIGPGNFKSVSGEYLSMGENLYSHNTFITVLTEFGVIGFLLFIGICYRVLRNIYAYYVKSSFNSFYFYFGLSFTNLLIVFCFLHDLRNKYFWGMFVMIAILLESKNAIHILANHNYNNKKTYISKGTMNYTVNDYEKYL